MSIDHINEKSSSDLTYQQVKLKLWHSGCWTLQATDRHSETHVIEKSLYLTDDIVKGDFIVVTDGDTTIDEFLETINGCSPVRDVAVLKQSANRARVVVNYTTESSIAPEIVDSEFMPIAPVHITEGLEHWRVMVKVDALGDVLDSMRSEYDVEVEAIERVDPNETLMFADVVNEVNNNLSPRQRETLFDALDEGYYNWPRETAANDIAESVGVSGPTFLEHIRRGEQKIINSVLKEIQLRNKRW